MVRAGRATWTVTPRGSGERVGRRANQFIAKCGDSLRELEEWSVPGGRDIDGQIRAGSGRADRRAANQTAYWLELLVDGKIVALEKLSNLRQECSELTAIFVTILKRSKEGPT